METYQYILIGVGVVALIVTVFLLLKTKKVQRKQYELPGVLELLDKSNIVSTDYIRNKIVITFKDVTLFNTELLHEKGAKGISIVGDKVKFYFDGENELNENIYNEIKKYIEG